MLQWKTPNQSYSEVGQSNPIRWVLLTKEGNTLTNTSNWFKCKDYLNDVVYAVWTGHKFGIYGWDTNKLVLPEKNEPMYLAVKDYTKQYYSNVKACLGNAVTFIEEGELDGHKVWAFSIAPEACTNTYFISLVTLMIRLCNTDVSFGSIDELKAYKKFPSDDQSKWDAVVKKGWMFNLPDNLKQYLWYSGEAYNSKKQDKPASSTIHNCGVLSWMQQGEY